MKRPRVSRQEWLMTVRTSPPKVGLPPNFSPKKPKPRRPKKSA